MRLLLDTHILLWALHSPANLKPHVHDAITDTTNEVFVSAASAWEIAIKSKIGKLSLRTNLMEMLHAREFAELNINFSHVLMAGNLPLHHNDPFDRLLIAQALLENLILITQDSYMDAYGCQMIRN